MNTFSRFSVLSPEVDLGSAHRIKIKPKQDKVKKDIQKGQNKVQSKSSKQSASAELNKKKKNENNDLQALAFGFGKPKNNKKGCKLKPTIEVEKKAQKNNTSNKVKSQHVKDGIETQDDDWHKRDEIFVKDENEKSLREAILQSKLEFEEKKKVEELDSQSGRDKCKEKEVLKKSSKIKKKKDKPITISLDEFNKLQPNELANLKELKLDKKANEETLVLISGSENLNDEKFFTDVDETTKKTLEKELRNEQYKQLKANSNKVNLEIQLKILLSEIAKRDFEMEKKDFEIQALGLEVDSLKSQMLQVKTRNKKLCEVISLSEMRSKGELVVELERATKGRDEFSEEIATLTAELEQEKTKVSNLTTELKKLQQGKKRNADSFSK